MIRVRSDKLTMAAFRAKPRLLNVHNFATKCAEHSLLKLEENDTRAVQDVCEGFWVFRFFNLPWLSLFCRGFLLFAVAFFVLPWLSLFCRGFL